MAQGTLKDSKQAKVRVGYDGRVHKYFYGKSGKVRFDNEVKILTYLEEMGCDFVPKIMDQDASQLYLVTSNCGKVVDHISDDKLVGLFSSLEQYGVRHEDPFPRNVTYNPWQGRFNIIDFEFATRLDTGEGLVLSDIEIPRDDMEGLAELERLKAERQGKPVIKDATDARHE